MNNQFMLNGMRIVEHNLCTVDGDPVEVRRTWKERLFTRPWTPFKACKTIIPRVPSPDFIVFPGNVLVGHPETVKALRNVKEQNERYGYE